MKNFLCLQPEYVGRFVCDGSKCDSNCCKRSWNIYIDDETRQKYLQFDPKIAEHLKFHEKKNQYMIVGRPCPFLTEQGLCRLQLERGEDFLSAVCKTYPRVVRQFGEIFERSLTLTCPLAAEMILFEREPMKFEFVPLPEKNLSVTPLEVPEKFLPHVVDIQIAMISILQERTLTIDRRLIVLGFFLDKLDEIFSETPDEDALKKLIAAYESKNFFATTAPQIFAGVHFDEKKFADLMSALLKDIFGDSPNGKYFVSVAENRARMADKFKIFREKYATFAENYIVNEIFMNCYPWRFTESIAINFAVFVATYKIFELLIFSITRKGFDKRSDLLKIVEEFAAKTDHTYGFYEKIFCHVKKIGGTFALIETLLEQER